MQWLGPIVDQVARQALTEARQETVSVGALESVRGRLTKILFSQFPLILPLDKGQAPQIEKSFRQPPHSAEVSAPLLLATIRGLLDHMEDWIARSLPHRSSGQPTDYNFRGRQKMTRDDGDAIRADYQRLGASEALFRKWCFDGKYGFSGGQGNYTRAQVSTAVGHAVGRHRRRLRQRVPVSLFTPFTGK